MNRTCFRFFHTYPSQWKVKIRQCDSAFRWFDTGEKKTTVDVKYFSIISNCSLT